MSAFGKCIKAYRVAVELDHVRCGLPVILKVGNDFRSNPKSGHVRCTRDVRFVPIADIDVTEIFDLLQPGLPQAFKKFWHLVGRVWNVLLTPSDGDVGLQFS